MRASDPEAAAARLWEAERSGRPCAPVRDLLAANDIEAAYAAQLINVTRAQAAGRRLVGRKIGLTSSAVQRQLGVDQPDFGALFDDMLVPEGSQVPARRLLQPKIEAEVAFLLNADLNRHRLTISDVIGAIEYALPALEIVDSRIANWDISPVDTIADNASSGLFTLGGAPKRLTQVNLGTLRMRMTAADQTVSTGTGTACLGHPLNAVTWLAQTLYTLGHPLRAGDIVLSGALGPMVSVERGQTYTAELEGLGSVAVSF